MRGAYEASRRNERRERQLDIFHNRNKGAAFSDAFSDAIADRGSTSVCRAVVAT